MLADRMAAAGVEFIAVSFVRAADDIRKVAAVVDGRAELVAKIETSTALANLGEILEASDAIMVARGDLGIDCPLEDVPHLQKAIIRRCVEFGMPVITATQMLESMVTAPSPTRAEVTDVANAIFDGTDALMLSGETAIGHDPALVVATMSRIAERAEEEAQLPAVGGAARPHPAPALGLDQRPDHGRRSRTPPRWPPTTSAPAPILCCTSSGRTAKAMARFRPRGAAAGAVAQPAHRQRARTLSWGVEPVPVDVYASTDEIVWYAVERSVRDGLITTGDVVVVLAGSPERPACDRRRRAAASCRSNDVASDGSGVVDDHRRARRVHDRARSTARSTARRGCSSSAAVSRTRFRVTRYDRRGYGRSLAVGGPFDIDAPGRRSDRRARQAAPVAPSATCCSVTASAATSRSPPPSAIPTGSPASPSTRRRCRGSTGGRPTPPVQTPRRGPATPFDAAERFMRRLVGDARWERLPPATREARRLEGPALVGELSATSPTRRRGRSQASRAAGAGDARRARPAASRRHRLPYSANGSARRRSWSQAPATSAPTPIPTRSASADRLAAWFGRSASSAIATAAGERHHRQRAADPERLVQLTGQRPPIRQRASVPIELLTPIALPRAAGAASVTIVSDVDEGVLEAEQEDCQAGHRQRPSTTPDTAISTMPISRARAGRRRRNGATRSGRPRCDCSRRHQLDESRIRRRPDPAHRSTRRASRPARCPR